MIRVFHSRYLPKRNENIGYKETFMRMFRVALFTIGKKDPSNIQQQDKGYINCDIFI